MSDILTEEEVAEDLQAIHGDWMARAATYCDSRACTPHRAMVLVSPSSSPLAGDRGDVFVENGRLQIGELGFMVGSPVIVTSELTNEVFAGVLDSITPHEVRRARLPAHGPAVPLTTPPRGTGHPAARRRHAQQNIRGPHQAAALHHPPRHVAHGAHHVPGPLDIAGRRGGL